AAVGARRRHRHPGARSAARLRAVRAGGARQGVRRAGAGALRGPADRRRPRGRRARREFAGRRVHLRGRTAQGGTMKSVARAPVLIVEDDADIRELLSSVLVLEGYPVVTAADGAEGLEQLRTAHPALVLLDLMMPSMDGWEFRRLQMLDPALAGVPTV